MRSRHVVALLIAVALVAARCAAKQLLPPEPPPQEIAGYYTQGEQSSWFEPCTPPAEDSSGGSMWWVTFRGESAAQFDEARATGTLVSGERYFVRFMAATTTSGQVGPQGAGVPALVVKQILEIRRAGAGDCPPPGH